jgi:Ca2+-transporting ATPase
MAIDEGRRNSQNQNSRKLRKCYYHLYGQNENAYRIKWASIRIRFSSDKLYEKSNGVRKRQKKSLKSQCGQASLYLLIRWKNATKVSENNNDTRRQFSMIHEYPLDGKPWWRTCLKIRKANNCCKGGPETIIKYPTSVRRNSNKFKIQLALASKGYHILGVGYSNYTETNYPQNQQDLSFHFVGLVVFYDPQNRTYRV